jgi:putative transposase
VTIVAWQREMLFGEIVDGELVLNDFGKIVLSAWFDLPNHYRHAKLGAFVIMPNHVHGIILLNDNRRGQVATCPLRNFIYCSRISLLVG